MVRKLFKNKSMFLMMVLASVLVIGEFAFAQQDIEGVANRFQGYMSSLTNAATAIAMFIGIVFGIVGVMKLFERGKDERSAKLSTIILCFLASALLIGLPLTLTIMKNSSVGSGSANSIDDSVYDQIGR